MPVRFDDLKPGMKLAADLREPGGRLLLPNGTELTERHLRYFQMWGVQEAQIMGEGPPVVVPVDPVALAEAEAATTARFRHSDLAHPAVAVLHRYCVQRMLRQPLLTRQHGGD
jgi:hypothetical protein